MFTEVAAAIEKKAAGWVCYKHNSRRSGGLCEREHSSSSSSREPEAWGGAQKMQTSAGRERGRDKRASRQGRKWKRRPNDLRPNHPHLAKSNSLLLIQIPASFRPSDQHTICLGYYGRQSHVQIVRRVGTDCDEVLEREWPVGPLPDGPVEQGTGSQGATAVL